MNFVKAFLKNKCDHFCKINRNISTSLMAGDPRTAPDTGDPAKLDVLQVSPNFLVVSKVPDLVINDDDPERPSLYNQVRANFPHLADDKVKFGFRVLHRLDFSTSGILVIPLTAQSAKAGSKSFSNRLATKFYLALVRGHLERDRVRIRNEIGEDTREEWRNVKMCPSEKEYCCDKPRSAETKLIVLSRGNYEGEKASKVLLQPITGRRHQLRVHCDCLGHTIVGDFTYSERKDTQPPRMFLHAQRLILPNAVEPLDIRTVDPFAEGPSGGWNSYQPEEEVCPSLEDAYDLFVSTSDWQEAR